MRIDGLHKIILNLKAIQFACLSAAQEDTHNAIITMDLEAQNNLKKAVEILEKLTPAQKLETKEPTEKEKDISRWTRHQKV